MAKTAKNPSGLKPSQKPKEPKVPKPVKPDTGKTPKVHTDPAPKIVEGEQEVRSESAVSEFQGDHTKE